MNTHSFISKLILSSLPLLFAVGTVTGCEAPSLEGCRTDPAPGEGDETSLVDYTSLYDEISNKGQYYFPVPERAPKAYWTVPKVATEGNRNSTALSSTTSGLQYHLLTQSLAGIVNRALQQGKTDVGVWIDVSGVAYDKSRAYLGKSLGNATAVDLCTKDYEDVDGIKVSVRSLIDGYVLSDVVNNPESGNVAAVASHVYNSIIVDIRDKEVFDNAGFQMKYDARGKTTQDAWNEFKDKCNKSALVVMPVQTGELREYAIANSLFVFNLNKQYNKPSAGQNNSLFDEVLSWLSPNAPVLGWEQGVGEDVFVDKVSKYGKVMIPADWSYNHTLTSVRYPERQEQTLAKVVNPKSIDYDARKKFVSFFLSDGDNYQWVMNDSFLNSYFNLMTSNNSVKMSFGLGSEALCQLSPARFTHLWGYQRQSGTVMETFGGGYFYIDTYSTAEGTDRKANLKVLAERAAAHMRQHRIKVLHLIAKDLNSAASREAFQAFIDANDQLEGIVAIAYSPYTAGGGQIQWFNNTEGYDIPVVTAKYALWAGISDSSKGMGTPSEVAGYIKSRTDIPSWSAAVVHAWSEFDGKKSADAALSCAKACGDDAEAVNIQELIWRIRMAKRPHETKAFLNTIK